MLSYCEYLAIKKMNPQDDCYIETIIYDIPECNDVICQWNGYELDKVFNLHAPNIHSIINSEFSLLDCNRSIRDNFTKQQFAICY